MIEEQAVSTIPTQATKSRPPRRWKRRYVWLGLGLLIGVLAVSGWFTFQAVRERATSGAAYLQTAARLLKGEGGSLKAASVQEARQALAFAQADFKTARQSIGGFGLVLPLVVWLPGPGYDAANLDTLLEIAEKTSRAGVLSLEATEPALQLFDPARAGLTAGGKLIKAVELLATPESQARFGEAARLLDEVSRKRAILDRSRLGLAQTGAALDQLDQQLPALREGLEVGRELLPLLPTVLGKNQPANYLVLIQNSDELRPTGGFISALGLLTLEGGKLAVSAFQDSYALSDPATALPAPEALTRYMEADYLLLRDANWWPDFPTSARQIAQLYQQSGGRPVDGVIAIDSQAVAYIFEALGSLDLPDYKEQLTAQNFEERLRHYYLPPGTTLNDEWWAKRKEFIGVVMRAMLGRLNESTAREYLSLASWLGHAAQEKHLQVYLAQPQIGDYLARRGLDGAQAKLTQDKPADYLMVVDTNVGFNKVNPKVERLLSYTVAAGGEGASIFASLSLTYTNRGGVREGTQAGECRKVTKYDSSYESMMNGCYWNYLRVYVPANSRLRAATGFTADNYPSTASENNRTVFASQLVIPPGATASFSFDYVLPYRLGASADYELTVQQQAGSRPAPMAIRLLLAGQEREWQTTANRDYRLGLALPIIIDKGAEKP